jgi:hypothetical protein
MKSGMRTHAFKVCDDRARPKHLRENDDKEGRVIEAPQWTKEEIEAGRRRDKEARTKYLAGASAAANVSIPADRPVEPTWLERFIALLKSVF